MTNGVPALRLRRIRLTARQRIVLLTVGVAAAALTLFVVAVRELPTASSALPVPWLLWAAAFTVSEALVVHVQWQREAHTFSMTDLVLGAGLLLATPHELVTAQVVGYAVTLVAWRRQRGLKLAFNVAQSALGACLATTVYSLVSGPAGLWDWAAALLAVLFVTLTADLCIFSAISISEGRTRLRPLWDMIALSVPFTLGSATLGLVLARSAAEDPPALALLALPAVLLVAAYRASNGARQQQENLRLLYETSSLLQPSGDSHDALGDFLGSVRTAFRAEMAELVLVGSCGWNGATLSRSLEDAEAVVMAPIADLQDRGRLVGLAATHGALSTRTKCGGGRELKEYIGGRGVKDAIAATLRTEDRVLGLLLVGGRKSDVSTFSRSDAALLETFARHVATSLERGRLEETLRQVTDLKEQLRHQALHDSLTGLPNRALFVDRARQAVDKAGRTRCGPAVLYIDLDGFKPVNDTHGHDAGDLLLRAVAGRIRGCLRPADTAARLGGDEFAVLLSGPIDRRGVERVIERIRAQLDVPVDLGDGRLVTVGMSIGVAIGEGAGACHADTLIRRADIAMYVAKRDTGTSYAVFQPGMGDTGDTRQDAAAELAAAVRGGEISVLYQPLVDMRTGRPVGAEALVRWQHPERSMRRPESFIPLAEDTGLITEIGGLVLRDACRQAARWIATVPDGSDLLVTVNLSARQLTDDGLVDVVAAALTEAQLEPHHLVLEITETMLMQDRDAAATALWQLKRLGVRIAIDDFGTGYSSLAYLRRFPIDMLKVAREFIDGLGRDAHDDVITRAIVELADTLGLLTVAEGIETTEQRNHVSALGCDIAQGYLFSHPVRADAALELISGRASCAASGLQLTPA